MRIGVCEVCEKEDYTGWMPCLGKWLCPACAARRLHVDEKEVRVAIINTVFLPNKAKAKKGGEKYKH